LRFLVSRFQGCLTRPAKSGSLILLMVTILVLLMLTACSDEVSGTGTPAQSSVSNDRGTRTTGNGIPTVPPPTPTYTPLPVKPTLPPTPTPPVVVGGKATGAVLRDPLTLHPYKENNASGQQFLPLLYSASLVRLDPVTLQPQPSAAARWVVEDTTVTFTLKDGLKWSDGRPITSADYLWTYQQAAKAENGWPLAQAAVYKPDFNNTGIESYQAPDPRTLVIKFRGFSSDIVSRADVIEPLPSHIWGTLNWNDPAKNPQIKAPTVVSGPWKLKEWKPDISITFERNPVSSIYPAPRLESLTFNVVPDSQVALQKVKTGEVDFYSPSPAEFNGFSQLPNVQTYTWGPARPTWYFAGFNFQKPDLQDKTLRQALAWATDYQGILDKQGSGLGRQLNSSLSPWHPAFNPNTARYNLNLAKAQELLKQAGYIQQNNRLTTKAGKPIGPLKLIYNSPSPLYEGLANTLKTNFASLGIVVELRNFDYENYQKFLASPNADFDIFLSGWRADYSPENFVDVWHAVPNLNSGSYQNSRLLDMYTKAKNEPDTARRKEWLDQAQAIEAEELPYIFLYAEEGRLVVNKRLAGFTPGLLGPEQNRYTDWFASK
jgi:peptide/nickel transport system substrate-binding protein